jgi:hypothetical protein
MREEAKAVGKAGNESELVGASKRGSEPVELEGDGRSYCWTDGRTEGRSKKKTETETETERERERKGGREERRKGRTEG